MINKPTLVCMLILFQLSAYAQQTYKLDLKKSKILWRAPKTMGSSRHNGFVFFNSGSINYSLADQPTDGIFNLNMNSIVSIDHPTAAANKKVDDELKSPMFFTTAKYPTASMNVRRIISIPNKPNSYNVSGDLTMKGVTHPIEFVANIKRTGNTVNATGSLKIDRIKWNIHHEPKAFDLFSAIKDGVIADEIPISLNLVFIKN